MAATAAPCSAPTAHAWAWADRPRAARRRRPPQRRPCGSARGGAGTSGARSGRALCGSARGRARSCGGGSCGGPGSGGSCCGGRGGALRAAAAQAARLRGWVLGRRLEGCGQLAAELSRGGRAVLGLLRHPAPQHLGGSLRGARPGVEQVRRSLGGDPVRDLQRGAALARPPAAERLERDRRERVHVGRRPRPAAVELLGRHVGGRAQHGAAARDLGAIGSGGDSEVGELRDPVLADQHVAGLHVTVNHAL